MINFLRRKRMQLANDNKVLKYLRYAFGEIILVVLGILIALQINNWNKSRMDHRLGESYLIRLHNELTKDTTYLNSTFTDTEHGIKNITQELQRAYETQNTREDINSLLNLQNFYADALTINTSTYEDLVNTQNLNIIRNDSLRFLIVDYYRNAELAAKAIDNFNQLAFDLQIECFTAVPVGKYYPWNLRMFSENQLNYKKDFNFIKDPTSYEFKLMESMQILFLDKHQYLLHFYQDLEVQATDIIHLINQELE
jgi:hypothetical protein